MAKLVISGDGKMGTMLAQGLDKVDGFEVVGLVSPLADSPCDCNNTAKNRNNRARLICLYATWSYAKIINLQSFTP